MSSHCKYDSYMTKEQLHEALDRAYQAGRRLDKIAEECNIKPASLRQFRSNMAMGEEYRNRLEEWLRVNGYTEEQSPATVRRYLAQQMRLVANMLDNPGLPDEFVAESLYFFLKGGIKSFVRAGLLDARVLNLLAVLDDGQK